MVKATGSRAPRLTCGHTKNTILAQLKALEGITHPSKASRTTPTGCAHAHPPDSPLLTQKQIKNYPWWLVLKPLKECSTPPQARGILSGTKMPRYSTDGEIQHPVQSLKPHQMGPSKVNSPKARTACQSLAAQMTNSIPPEPCGEVLGEMSVSGDISPPRPSPCGVIKSARPPSLLPPSPRDTCNPLPRR
jgi:hypothetical protein